MKSKKPKTKKKSSKDVKSKFNLGKIVKVPFEKMDSLPVYAACFEHTNGGCSFANSYTGSAADL